VPRKTLLFAALALATFLFGWLVTAQVRSQPLPPSNRVARNDALLQSVTDLELQSAAYRERIRALQHDVRKLEQQHASRSVRFLQAKEALDSEKMAAGQSPVSGPGLSLTLDDGKDPNTPTDRSQAWLIRYQDLQDLTNLLWGAGAEAVALNRHRVAPTTALFYAGVDVLMNGSIRISAPFQVQAIGSAQDLEEAVRNPDQLSDLKKRVRRYKMHLTWKRESRQALPAYDSAFVVKHATLLP
jgi:uncharacterized protein YlxW (UPF0749 family)